jgi:pimeloyl-ACP methyl ester carboxylesterase
LMGSPAGGSETGLYLWSSGQPASSARLLTPLSAACINAARFVRTSGDPLVFLSEGCSPDGQGSFWRVLDLNDAQIAAIHPVGLPIALEPSALLFLGKLGPSAVDQTIYRFSVPSGPPAKWVGGPIYVPDAADNRPAIVHTGPEPFPTSVALLDEHHLVAIAVSASDARLIGLCTANNVTRNVDLSSEIPKVAESARLAVEGDNGYAVVSEWDLWGRRQQYLLSIKAGASGPCSADTVAVSALPSGDRPGADPGPIAMTRASVAADDGEDIPYLVLSRPGSRGPELVTAYGASDLPVYGMAALPIEQAWIERGGRLVIVTVRGDAREPPWRNNPQGDYQARAAKDLNTVVRTLVSQNGGQGVTSIGASAGAFTVARAALLRPDLYTAAVLVSGPLDLSLNSPMFGPPSGGFAQWYSDSQHGDGACDAVQFFIYQGGKDDRVNPQSAVNFAHYVSSLGYHGSLQMNPAAGHYVLEDPSAAVKILSDLDAWSQTRAACPAHPPTGAG